MEKKFFYAQVPPLRCGKDLDNRWKYEIPAYRVAPGRTMSAPICWTPEKA